MIRWDTLLNAIVEAGGPTLSLISARPVGGGDINEAWHLRCEEGDFFLKTNRPGHLRMFACEAHALDAIRSTRTIRCPRPIAWGEGAGHAFLLMEYLPLGHRGDDAERGRMLARLHLNGSEDGRFGWFEDNFIGRTPQPNGWMTDWSRFYGERRLHHLLQLAQSHGAPRHLYDSGLKLIEKLPAFFSDYTPRPALLHGDLWGGNSAFTAEGEPVIYDPASYYGDHEADLAMTELFGGFSGRFYDAYAEVFPIDAGYRTRKTLYNLYHILNHYVLFGGHYGTSAQRMIDQLLAAA